MIHLLPHLSTIKPLEGSDKEEDEEAKNEKGDKEEPKPDKKYPKRIKLIWELLDISAPPKEPS